jgi:asparagine synthase (glutamine-hydrolysing)
MTSACKRFVMSYNGEIYNFTELRKQLEHQGFHFRGHSDTEVLLGAVTEWGLEKNLENILGMFAIALWDKEQEALTLVRDPVGKKPLFYGWCDNTFLFASELKALRAHPEFNQPIDPDTLGLFIKYSWVPSPYCIYQGLRKLHPTIGSQYIHGARRITPVLIRSGRHDRLQKKGNGLHSLDHWKKPQTN